MIKITKILEVGHEISTKICHKPTKLTHKGIIIEKWGLYKTGDKFSTDDFVNGCRGVKRGKNSTYERRMRELSEEGKINFVTDFGVTEKK